MIDKRAGDDGDTVRLGVVETLVNLDYVHERRTLGDWYAVLHATNAELALAAELLRCDLARRELAVLAYRDDSEPATRATPSLADISAAVDGLGVVDIATRAVRARDAWRAERERSRAGSRAHTKKEN